MVFESVKFLLYLHPSLLPEDRLNEHVVGSVQDFGDPGFPRVG